MPPQTQELSAEHFLVVTLIVQVAVAAVLSTMLVRFWWFRRILLTEKRDWPERLVFAASLGIPLVAMLSVIVFVCSFVPVLGVFISTTPIVLVALNAGGPGLSLSAIALVIVIYAIEAYVLNPLIYGRHLKLNPVLTLIILYVGYHAFGLWGMSGNVWEWCQDRYRPDGYGDGRQVVHNPQGPQTSHDPQEPGVEKRVMRGGSFLCSDAYCLGYQPGTRMKSTPDTSLCHTGFRCALTAPPPRAK